MGVIRRLLAGAFVGSGLYWLWRYYFPQHSDLVLEDRVVLINGAASGIGHALAIAFARRGARLVLVDHRKEILEDIEHEIEPYAGDVMTINTDVSGNRNRERILNRILKTFGQVDVLVNGPGVAGGGLLEEHEESDVEEIINTNLINSIQLTRQILPQMLRQGEGYIVNIGSALGRVAAPGAGPYVASTFGLSGFSDSLRRELDGTGIDVLLVLPGWTRSAAISDAALEIVEQSLTGHIIEDVESIAEKIVDGLVKGASEMVFGARLHQFALLLERYMPGVMRLYWQRVFPRWLEAVRQINRSPGDH
jgi:short-subunit dehydrogenase